MTRGITGTHLVGVSIAPWAIRSVFGADARELANTVVDAEDLLGPDVIAVWERVVDAASVERRYEAVMTFLRRCRDRFAGLVPASVLRATQAMVRSGGRTSIQDLCTELGLSRKHLSGLFKRTIGFTPKL